MRSWVVGLVAWREIAQRLSGRTTWTVTALTTVLAVGLIVGSSLINQQAGATRIGLVGPQAQALAPALSAAARAAKVSIATVPIASVAEARAELTPTQGPGGGGRLAKLFAGSSSQLDVALTFDGTSATILAYQTVPSTTLALVHAVLNAVHQQSVLAASGVDASTITSSLTPVPLTAETIAASGNQSGLSIAALASALLLVYGVAGFASSVATGVAQEKTSRTAELLVSAIRPRELMTGKVLGIGLVGLGTMTVTVGAALMANAFVKGTNIPPGLGPLLPLILVWFVLGFTLYAFAFAAAGAMVARQEEVQSVSLPLAAFQIVGFLLVYVAIASPDNPWIRILSFLPPWAPVLMPARAILGTAQAWEVLVAAGLELLAIWGMVVLTARIYRGALVRGGARLTWSEALRLGRGAR